MKKIVLILLLLIAVVALYLINDKPAPQDVASQLPATIEGRAEYELLRLADPVTGEIPANIRMRELAYASTLPNYASQRSELALDFASIGPYNVGGRTRAFAIDQSNVSTYLAGGVSGGMWRSTDAGNSWTRVTAPEDHAAVSCVHQDPRPGKENHWYYGSGEVVGNSASKSFSAYYRGNGVYRSTDGGQTWSSIQSTIALQHTSSDWDAVFRVLVDPTRTDSTILLAAIPSGIMRSNDDGQTWTPVIGGALSSDFTDLAVTTDGVFYACISQNLTGFSGLWRSTDGLNWVNITPSGFPSNHDRTVMAIPAIDENQVFFFSSTPNAGTNNYSLWRYEYLSGDGTGSGGSWEDRSPNLPPDRLSLFGGYCQVVAVKPDDPDVIFIGGTSLYRSMSGFTDTLTTSRVGGYGVDGDTNYNFRTGVHYPDQQRIAFDPTNYDRMISTTDGGIHRTENCTAQFLTWERLSRGYVTSQFYGIGIDHGTEGSEEVMGGLQDRGTFWTNQADATVDWVSVRGADGAYVWIEDGGEHHYMSTQYANIQRSEVDQNGEKNNAVTVMPEQLGSGAGQGWLFVHPFTLDPVDNNIMYLPNGSQIWRNTNLAAAEQEDLSFWSIVTQGSGTVTAIAASENPQGVVYWGTSNRNIYRMEDSHLSSVQPSELVSDSISSGTYTSCIAIDPSDADKVIVVYSNYNVVSLWYSENGGETWTDIEGNLSGTPDEGVPPHLSYIGDGPSIRWAEIAPTDQGNVYFIGTSVGLFSTRELNGDSTVWTQEGVSTIGNVVVDMLDYRASDQWLAVGTHGNGIYTATIAFEEEPDTTIDSTVSVGFVSEDILELNLYPNPTTNMLNVDYQLTEPSEVTLRLFDQSGRTMKTLKLGVVGEGRHTQQLDLSDMSSGLYYCSFKGGGLSALKKVVKE